MKEKLHTIPITIGVKDFVYAFGRKPKNMDKFETFCRYCEKGIHAQIDWDILVECTKEAMEEGKHETDDKG